MDITINPEISLLDQVKMQAQVLVPVLRALRAELGKERADRLVEPDEGVFDFAALRPVRVPDDVQRRKAHGQDVGLLALPEFVEIDHPRGHPCEIFI